MMAAAIQDLCFLVIMSNLLKAEAKAMRFRIEVAIDAPETALYG